MQKEEEKIERNWLTRTIGFAGYTIIEDRTDSRKFDYRIRKNRP